MLGITAAAARQCGMEPHLFYFERRPTRLTGNLLLNDLLGAKLHFVPFGGGGDGGMTVETTIRLARLVAWPLVGRTTSSLSEGIRGGAAWATCARRPRSTSRRVRSASQSARLVVAAGSGGTLAGLLAGLTLLDSPLRPLGIDVGKLWKGFPASIGRLAAELCARLGATATPSHPLECR